MISYARGLILKHGDRLMVFKNKLDDQRVQFEYTDNGQYITETIGENYRSIRNGKYSLSRSPCVVGGAQDVDGLVTVLPAHIDPTKKKESPTNSNSSKPPLEGMCQHALFLN